MRKVTSSILVALFILCFIGYKNFAFGDTNSSDNPKCRKYDFFCKRTGSVLSEDEKKTISVEESNTNSGTKRKCPMFDLYCKRTNSGMVKEEIKNDTDKRAKIITNESDTELNFFTGLFDFSDDKQRSGLLGLQHQNEELFRNSFLGKLSPITGGFLTEKNAFYLYTGVQAEYELGFLTINPSFAPGYYDYGDGKDLGAPLEFKSEVQLSFDLSDGTHLGMSYNHISNASLGTKNPGANSYMFNFLKQF